MCKKLAGSLALMLFSFNVLSVSGQEAANDNAYEQTRRRIWCETFKFIYHDHGGDSLLNKLDCDSWKAMLDHATKNDGRYGAYGLYRAVDKPAIYAGISSDEQKLNKLAGEIQYKLMYRRKGNKRKEASVDSLYKTLQRTALMMVGSGESPIVQQVQNVGIDGGPRTENLAEGEPEVILDQKQNLSEPDNGYSMNEILQWILMLLMAGAIYWLYSLLQKVSEKNADLRARVKVLDGIVFSQGGIKGKDSSTATASQQRNIKDKNHDKLVVSVDNQAKGTVNPKRTNKIYTPVNKEASTNTSKTPPVVKQENIVDTPERSLESKPEVKSKIESQGKPENTGNPSQQEVAPNQAPTASTSQIQPPATPPPAPAQPVSFFYDKMPVRGGFHQGALSKSPQRDSLYVIQPTAGNGQEAYYSISEDPEVQKYAMQNGLSFFEEGCIVEEVKENPLRVINIKQGFLRKDGPSWQIVEKARIKFE